MSLTQGANDLEGAFKGWSSTFSKIEDNRIFGRDSSNLYYDFLYWTVQKLAADVVVELGTCTGGSTSYLAAAGAGSVTSIDRHLRPEAVDRLSSFSNITLIEGDSRSKEIAESVAANRPIDLLF